LKGVDTERESFSGGVASFSAAIDEGVQDMRLVDGAVFSDSTTGSDCVSLSDLMLNEREGGFGGDFEGDLGEGGSSWLFWESLRVTGFGGNWNPAAIPNIGTAPGGGFLTGFTSVSFSASGTSASVGSGAVSAGSAGSGTDLDGEGGDSEIGGSIFSIIGSIEVTDWAGSTETTWGGSLGRAGSLGMAGSTISTGTSTAAGASPTISVSSFVVFGTSVAG